VDGEAAPEGCDAAGGVPRGGVCELECAGLEAVGLEAVGLDAAGLEAVGLECAGLECAGPDAVGGIRGLTAGVMAAALAGLPTLSAGGGALRRCFGSSSTGAAAAGTGVAIGGRAAAAGMGVVSGGRTAAAGMGVAIGGRTGSDTGRDMGVGIAARTGASGSTRDVFGELPMSMLGIAITAGASGARSGGGGRPDVNAAGSGGAIEPPDGVESNRSLRSNCLTGTAIS
jgi:hypothetical protein